MTVPHVPDPDPELRLDLERRARTGLVEAVYAPGKTAQQCAAAVTGLLDGSDAGPVLLTRARPEQRDRCLVSAPEGTVHDTGRDTDGTPLSLVSWRHAARKVARLLVVTAGTSDLPVAREAVAVLAAYGCDPALVTDVGVAGLHRVLAHAERLADADAVMVVAGMEGALASVVSGLTAAPVVAVPTSTGYGAGLAGITALLGMHAGCSPGVTVVGIDNGFGAACAVLRVLSTVGRMESR
ncbi:MAG: nickel pincer cofactor biosynthesis protein LarB [Marmoricola sp.]